MKPGLFLLALPLAALPLLVQESAAPTIRDELTAVYDAWSKARTDFDRATFEELLAPDFYVQLGSTRLSRQQFVEEISTPQPNARLTRFDSRILTLAREGDAWVAVITEKLEYEAPGADGKPARLCSLWVTRDRFRKADGAWRVLSSEAIGNENWGRGKAPPFEDWKS